MNKALPLLVALFLWFAAPASALEVGETAAAFTAADFDGAPIDYPQVAEGRPTIMIFWATWCPHCAAFMPYLKEIQADYGASRIAVVAVNIQEDGSGDPRAYIRDLGFPVTAVAEGDAIAAEYDVDLVPTIYVLNASAQLQFVQPFTTMPAGDTVAGFWDRQVRRALDRTLE